MWKLNRITLFLPEWQKGHIPGIPGIPGVPGIPITEARRAVFGPNTALRALLYCYTGSQRPYGPYY